MTNMPAGVSADQYDEYVTKYTKPWNDYLIERIHEEIESLEATSKCIVDVGTGTAHTLIEMAKSESFHDFRLIGLDFFEDMVEQAKENIASHGLETRIEVIHGDVHQMNIPDDSVDLVFGRSVIHHWENPGKAYQEIHRILAPGGVCIIHEPSREPSQVALEKFNKLRSEFGISEMSTSEKLTADEVRMQLVEVGLDEVASVYQGEGLSSLGFELRIAKLQS